MNLKELKEERCGVEGKMREMLDHAEAENRDMTEEENQRFEELHKAECEFRSRIERQEKLEEIQRAAEERKAGDLEARETRRATAVNRDGEHRNTQQYQGERRSKDESLAFEGWCLRSLKQHSGHHHHEAAKRLGIDIYQPSFEFKMASNSELRNLRRQFERRDLSIVGDVNNEQDVIRTDFISQLERELLAYGDVLRVATQFRTDSGNPLVIPTITDVTNKAGVITEATTMTGQYEDPTFGKVTFNAFKMSAGVKYTTEIEQDTGFDLTSELAFLIGERIGRHLSDACTTGNGTTDAQGVVTGSTLGHTAADDTELAAEDFLELIHSVDPAYRSAPGIGFMMHDKVLLSLRKLKETDTGRFLWQPSMQMGVAGALFGYPVYSNQSMADEVVAESKPVLFGDFSKFRVRLVRGVRLVVSRELYAETDEIGIIAHLRYDSRVVQPKAIKHLAMAGYGS